MLTTLTAIAATCWSAPVEKPEGLPDLSEFKFVWGDPVRVTLATPGGPLPFVIVHKRLAPEHNYDELTNAQEYALVYHEGEKCIVNGDEQIPISVSRGVIGGYFGGPSSGRVDFDPYGSWMYGTGWGGCIIHNKITDHMIEGEWKKQRNESLVSIPFTIKEVDSAHDRFDPIDTDEAPAQFSGRWRVDFDSSDDPAIGVFEVDDNQIATGTFLTTTGDYRYLEGRVDGDLMRLSTFDGAHAFLFHARLQSDGTIAGDFWSGDWHHDTWTATRDDDIELPDMFAQTTPVDDAALDELVFTNLDGTPTRVIDALDATHAPARIIEVFGTWCPNCADAGRELAQLKQTYGDDLGIVGLAFELTDDHDRSAAQVRRYLERFGADWDVLIAGLSDKDKATEELAILDRVRAYPTTIFLNADNEIVEIHTGFTGPATGDAYTRQHERYVSIIESLIHDD